MISTVEPLMVSSHILRGERLAFLVLSEKLREEKGNAYDRRAKAIGEFMLDDLGVGFASICFLFGTVLLFAAISQPSRDQTLTVIGGASLLSLGMMAVWRLLANKLKWWRDYKRYRERTD